MSTHSSVSANVYLTFSGNCREAMTFYQKALEGELEIRTFEGSPVEVPEEHKNNVMHATLAFSGTNIMASDSMPGDEINHGNGYSISLNSKDIAKGEKFFNNLSEGGHVVMPFHNTFWGAKFGMLKDKFGVQWMVNCELSKENA